MCRDSVNSDWVYFVKSGSCRVLKSLNETRPDLLGLEHQVYSPNVKSVKGKTRHKSIHYECLVTALVYIDYILL